MAHPSTLATLLLSAISAFVLVYGESEAEAPVTVLPITELCLGCICEATSGCNLEQGCDEKNICGLFRITKPYWEDAGNLTLPNDDASDPEAFKRCVKDPYCAAQTVTGYMNRYGRDCNGDGYVECYDYAAIHKRGFNGCKTELPTDYYNKLISCQKAVGLLYDPAPYPPSLYYLV